MSRWVKLAKWYGTDHHGGSMSEHRGLVVHIADGFYDGTIAWQQNAPAGRRVSSHFIVGRDGRCAQMVDTDLESWSQIAGNGTWMSIEFEGFSTGAPQHHNHPGWELLTAQQIEVGAQLLVAGYHQYGIPIQLATSPDGRGLGHHSMGGNAWGHLFCPGNPIIGQKPMIVARAAAIAGTPVPPVGEDDIVTKLPTLQYGDSGTPVKRVQTLANVLLGGGDVAVDGQFGPNTRAIVLRVQHAGAIAQDGVVGHDTWSVLLGVAP